jgi:TldD protein
LFDSPNFSATLGSYQDLLFPEKEKQNTLSPFSMIAQTLRSVAASLLLSLLVAPVNAAKTISSQQPSTVLLDALTSELQRAVSNLGTGGDGQQPPYFVSYSVSDVSSVSVTAQFGALVSSQQNHQRAADVQVRVGDPKLDNTHGQHRASALNTIPLPVTDDRMAIARSLWWATNSGYGSALENYLRVKTETQVRAKEEDQSPDFSKETPQVSVQQAAAPPAVDKASWENRIRNLSSIFRSYSDVYMNLVAMNAQTETNYFVSSEGSKIVTSQPRARVVVFAATRADDGMDLFLARTFEAKTVDELPSIAEMESEVRKMGSNLEELRKAPVTQPFNGPAILSGRAAAVFFHEVLGHRLEGQRQRGEQEGQTFTKDLNKSILPSFLSVVDDPTLETYGKAYLSGYYQYDDEGQRAQRVELIQSGILKQFLMSRLPINGFDSSNGHGRAETGRMPVGRQGNLVVTSTKTVSDEELRKMLIEEVKKQGKPYGLFFEDISSGFAVTVRNMPQAFQVMPLIVYRVYADGRPDELVRGVNIVGTPQAALNRIVATGTEHAIFNGECGAESGSIPVSAVAPAMLVTEIETQRQPQGVSRPPILPIPSTEQKGVE